MMEQSIAVGLVEPAFKELGYDTPDELIDDLQNIKVNIRKNYVSMSKLLYHIKYGKLYKTYGYEKWADFCSEKAEMDVRKADYLVSVWERMKTLNPAAAKAVASLDWSKAREVVRQVDNHNYQEWVQKAKELPYNKLVEEIKRSRDKAVTERYYAGETVTSATVPEETDKDMKSKVSMTAIVHSEETTAPMHFQLYPDSYALVVNALQAAASITRSSNRSYNLQTIAMEFVATHGNPNPKLLSDFLAMLERSLEATIVVIDNKTGQPIYGQESLEEAE